MNNKVVMKPEKKYIVVEEIDGKVRFIGRKGSCSFGAFDDSSKAIKAADYETAIMVAESYDQYYSDEIKIYPITVNYDVQDEPL